VDSTILILDSNVSVLLINVSNDFHNLSFIIGYVGSLVSEELPPS
jgi:hypothetical protein